MKYHLASRRADRELGTCDAALGPEPSEVLGEIGRLLAAHLALALAIAFTLQAMGID